MATSVRYSAGAAPALAFLKRCRNRIDIYVEDTTHRNFWLSILRSLLPGGVAISDVKMLGGRNEVVKACAADQDIGGRPRLYIIDGDFDSLLGVPKPNLKHLYRLQAYCLENYVIQEAALIEVATASDPNLSEADAKARIDFVSWQAAVQSRIGPLFAAYAAAHVMKCGVTSVAFSVAKLFVDLGHRVDICAQKCRVRRFSFIRQCLRVCDRAGFSRAYRLAAERTMQKGAVRVVSGKNYLLPHLHLQLQKQFGYRGTIEQMKIHLARSSALGRDGYLARRLARICNEHKLS